MANSKGDSSLEVAVEAVVTSDDAQQIAAEYAELGIDVLLESGIARDIPIVGTLVGITKVGVTIRDRLFAKKLFEFLMGLAQVNAKERRELVRRLQDDPAYGRRVGEHLTELIERVDAHKKPTMLAKIFLAYLDKEIDGVMLHRLCMAVERLPFFEVRALRPFHESEPEKRDAPVETLQNLLAAGLLSAVSGWGSLVYKPTEVADVFLRLQLDRLE